MGPQNLTVGSVQSVEVPGAGEEEGLLVHGRWAAGKSPLEISLPEQGPLLGIQGVDDPVIASDKKHPFCQQRGRADWSGSGKAPTDPELSGRHRFLGHQRQKKNKKREK